MGLESIQTSLMQLHTLIGPPRTSTSPLPFTIVFLHYFGGSSAEWRTVGTILCEQRASCRTLALDLRGHGKSPDGEDHSVATMAQDVLETIQHIEALHGLPYVLVGHSMGGKVAMQVASTQPENLAGLILVAPSPPTPEPMTDKERDEGLASWNDEAASRKSLGQITGISLQESDTSQFIHDRSCTTKAAWESWYTSGSLENIGSLMQKVQVPTAVIVGECDPVVPPEVQRRETLGYLHNAFLSVVPDAGHLLPYEAPDATAAMIAAALPHFV